MIVIGSRLIAHPVYMRPHSDTDIIARPDDYRTIITCMSQRIVTMKDTARGRVLFVTGDHPIEIEIAEKGSTGDELLDLIAKHNLRSSRFIGLDNYLTITGVSVDVEYALKMSHRFKRNSRHFKKTMRDIRALRAIGAYIPKYLEPWYKRREAETYDYAHPSLNQSKKAFFTDNVPYVYDHDCLHEAVRLYQRPAFEYIKEDTAEVKCSKAKFDSVGSDIRMATVLEEAYVLALERCLIPSKFTVDPRWAFEKALEKICTSISSGWWREFAWENYDNVLGLYSDSFVDKFYRARDKGQLKPYEAAA